VQIGRDGDVLARSVPYGYDGHPIRRALALADANGLDLAIARELIGDKLDGQRRILVRLGADLREFGKLRAALASADSIERVRVIEASAAALYFAAWRDVRIRFCERDLSRIPARWLRCDSRVSVLTGAPRAATSPINAMRNYLYACLESETRLALLGQGCDPTLGVLHADQRNRDSLALDAMEPVRRSLGRSRVRGARLRQASERHLPDRGSADARTRTHAATLARMPMADRGASRANLPRIASQQGRSASHARG
jgi:CRISPR-associated endonuclease Cas1